jgi:hypothetical protein
MSHRRSALVTGGLLVVILLLTQAPVGAQDVAGFGGYLPMIFKAEPQTATPVPTQGPSTAIINGNFEAGPSGWQQSSAVGADLITNEPVTTGFVPHSGTWYVWLGGADNEVSGISQKITIPANTTLTYWRWIASQDVCSSDADIAGVVLDIAGQSKAVDAFPLCTTANTNGWQRRDVDLRAYAGQTVDLYIIASTDDTFNSNLFIDDVSFSSGSPQPTATTPPQNCHSSYPTICIPPPPPDLNCPDIPYRNFQVVGSDPHNFDTDDDGIGCETGLAEAREVGPRTSHVQSVPAARFTEIIRQSLK